MDKSADIRMLLNLALEHLTISMFAASVRVKEDNELSAELSYRHAWLLAGCPPRCDEWPGYAVWSARETKARAA